MTGQLAFTGETEFSRIEVDVNNDDPEEWASVEIAVAPIYATDADDARSLMLSMDEARVLIAGLAAVIR